MTAGGPVGMQTQGCLTEMNFETEDRYFDEMETQTETYEESSLMRSKRHPNLYKAKEWKPATADASEETLKNVPPEGPRSMRVDGKKQLYYDDYEDDEPENGIAFPNMPPFDTKAGDFE